MTPDKHAAKAEELLNLLDEFDLSLEPGLLVAMAQAHATLAAVALADTPVREADLQYLAALIESNPAGTPSRASYALARTILDAGYRRTVTEEGR